MLTVTTRLSSTFSAQLVDGRCPEREKAARPLEFFPIDSPPLGHRRFFFWWTTRGAIPNRRSAWILFRRLPKLLLKSKTVHFERSAFHVDPSVQGQRNFAARSETGDVQRMLGAVESSRSIQGRVRLLTSHIVQVETGTVLFKRIRASEDSRV